MWRAESRALWFIALAWGLPGGAAVADQPAASDVPPPTQPADEAACASRPSLEGGAPAEAVEDNGVPGGEAIEAALADARQQIAALDKAVIQGLDPVLAAPTYATLEGRVRELLVQLVKLDHSVPVDGQPDGSFVDLGAADPEVVENLKDLDSGE